MKRVLALTAGAALGASVLLLAQNRTSYPIAAQDRGHIALGLALRKLNVSGTFMQIPAHPDDEHNALWVGANHAHQIIKMEPLD